MRKAFNFFRSYYDVASELSDKDRLAFYDALILEQFTGKKTELKGLAKFAYISQSHSIDSQTRGYNDRLKRTDIQEDEKIFLGSVAGCVAGGVAQEKEEEEEKVQISIASQIDFDKLLEYFNKVTNKKFKSIPDKAKKAFNARLKEGYTKNEIMQAILNCSQDEFHLNNPKYLTPEFISRPDKFVKYLNSEPTEQKVIDTRNPKNLPIIY
jgi:uncharacterized phage protein (TIGR02220 family)